MELYHENKPDRRRPVFAASRVMKYCLLISALLGLSLVCTNLAFALHTPLEWYEPNPYDVNRNKLDDRLDLLSSRQEPEVIICFRYDCRPDSLMSTILDMGGEIGYSSSVIASAVIGGIPVSDLQNVIAQWDEVGWIVPNEVITAFMTTAGQSLGAHAGYYSPNTAEDRGYDGTGVTIFIVDTGVKDPGLPGGHPDLPAAIGGVLVSNIFTGALVITNPNDENGHGTHVAGVALGRGDGSGNNRGTASGAALFDCRVTAPGSSGSTTVSAIQSVIDWLRLNSASITTGPRVVNISFGSITEANAGHPLAAAIDALVASGVVVCVAAGNNDNCPIDYAGNTAGIGVIAVAPNAITVASASDLSTFDRSDDVISDFSRVGPGLGPDPKPNITAYGADCTHACPDGCSTPLVHIITSTDIYGGYSAFSGTSAASPMVAGACALVLEMNPAMTPAAVKTLLTTTAEDKGAAGWDASWGSGLLDLRSIFPSSCDLAVTAVSYTPVPVDCNQPVTVNVTVKNVGASPVSVFSVRMQYWYFSAGNSPIRYDLTATPILNAAGPLNPNNTRVFTGVFNLKLLTTPLSQHSCFWGIVNAPCDINNSNNERYVNATIQNLKGTQCKALPPDGQDPFVQGDTMRIPIRIAHPFNYPIEVTVEAQVSDSLHWAMFLENEGVKANKLIVVVNPSGCPTEVDAVAYALNPGVNDSLDVNIRAYNEALDFHEGAQIIFLARGGGGCCDMAGDANDDGNVNVGDAVFIINYVFKGGDAPNCMQKADANADAVVNVGDAVHIINYVFKGGDAPICGP